MSINRNNLIIWSNIDLNKYFTNYRSAWHQENEKSVNSVCAYVNDQNQKWALLSCEYKAHQAPSASLVAV